MAENTSYYEKDFSDEGFWEKVKSAFKKAGLEVIEKALMLYYAADNPATPLWAKGVIYGALGYFISPIDAIPDFTPVVGYSDDLGVLVAAIGVVTMYIDDEVKRKVAEKLKFWFG